MVIFPIARCSLCKKLVAFSPVSQQLRQPVLRGSTRSWKFTVLRSVPISGASCSDGEISSEKWVPQIHSQIFSLRKKRAGRKWWPSKLAHCATFKTCSCPNLIPIRPIQNSQLEGFKISRTTTLQHVRQPLNLPEGSKVPKNLGTSPVSTARRLKVATWQRQSSCRPLPGTPRFSALWLDSCTFGRGLGDQLRKWPGCSQIYNVYVYYLDWFCFMYLCGYLFIYCFLLCLYIHWFVYLFIYLFMYFFI